MKKLESTYTYSWLPMQLGPYNDFVDDHYNVGSIGNIVSSSPGKFNNTRTRMVGNDEFKYDRDIKQKKIKRKKRKKIKRFKEYNEGAGFGRVDYRNVTGDATSSGYLGNMEPGSGAAANIISYIPRAEYYNPETNVVGFKEHDIKSDYFRRRKLRKKKQKLKQSEKVKDAISKVRNLRKNMYESIFDDIDIEEPDAFIRFLNNDNCKRSKVIKVNKENYGKLYSYLRDNDIRLISGQLLLVRQMEYLRLKFIVVDTFTKTITSIYRSNYEIYYKFEKCGYFDIRTNTIKNHS